MSGKYPVLTAKEVVRVLRRNGFELVSQSGSHHNGRQVIVPMHGSKTIPFGTCKSIVQGSGIDSNEFR